MTTHTCPVVGYLFPAYDRYDDAFDPEAICKELAEMEADVDTDAYDDSFYFYQSLSDWELSQIYASRCS